MEEKTKTEIVRLHNSGLGYKAIARRMSLPLGSVKTALRRSAERKCEECGKPMGEKLGRFCCDACRYKWWRHRRNCGERTCPICG